MSYAHLIFIFLLTVIIVQNTFIENIDKNPVKNSIYKDL